MIFTGTIDGKEIDDLTEDDFINMKKSMTFAVNDNKLIRIHPGASYECVIDFFIHPLLFERGMIYWKIFYERWNQTIKIEKGDWVLSGVLCSKLIHSYCIDPVKKMVLNEK